MSKNNTIDGIGNNNKIAKIKNLEQILELNCLSLNYW